MRMLRARARRFRDMLDGLPHGVVVQAAGEIRYANDAAARLLGVITPRQLVGRKYSELVLAAVPMHEPNLEQQTLRRADGHLLEVEAATRLLKRGSKRYELTTLRELPNRVAPRERAAERLRTLAEGTSAVIVLDASGAVRHWSDAAQAMSGYSAREMVGQPVSVLISAEETERIDLDHLLRQTLETGHCQIEGWKKRKDGSGFFAAQTVTALFDRDGNTAGFTLVVRDLTEQAGHGALRQSEEQLRQAQRMEAVGRLASGIAHDFNNLLTAIQGHAQFLTEDLPIGHPSRADVDEILHSSERAAALTRQLLAFSRGQSMQPETVQLNNIVAAMERLLRRVISEDIAVESVLDPALWPVRADPTQIEQVLVNLIVNARDAMPRGGRITIKTENAELATSYAQRREEVEPGEYVMLAVSDTGVGMDRDTQARIFEPFFTTKGPDKGTGLGLSTVLGIIKQMGGHVFVYSEVGQGTTFKVYLPRAGGSALHAAAPKRDEAHGRESVLIVEDDDSVRALARRVLDTRGYRVWTCASASEAFEIMEEYGDEMALLITDVVMPAMNGHDLVEQLRKGWPELAVVFMSGYTDDDVRRHGMVGATDHFIGKPFTPEGFARKVREVLDNLRFSLPQNRR
jgi:two-component system cell cycle sensor histidine kinase/response regulator CckA